MTRSTAHDFDFLIGQWQVHHRRLRKRLQDCADWETFEATGTVQKLPGGMANFDTLVAPVWRPGWVGQTFRVFDPVAQRWSIHWLTNEGDGIDHDSGHLTVPVVGGFDGDEGRFEAVETMDGRPVRVRFLWQRLGPDAARWQQAFSADGGASWETNWIMDFERATPLPTIDAQVVELRRYTLHLGARDSLVELFDRELVEPQEAVGMAVLGQGRELDSSDHFTWLRGFPDRAARVAALRRFYGGPVWLAHRDAANATMIDSDDVLLLRPAWPGSGLLHRPGRRGSGGGGWIEVTVRPLRAPAEADLLAHLRTQVMPALAGAGALEQGWYVEDPRPNDFPRLPVRHEGPLLVSVVVWASGAAGSAIGAPESGLGAWSAGPARVLRLAPTAASALHGGG
jgi:NIPSNAP